MSEYFSWIGSECPDSENLTTSLDDFHWRQVPNFESLVYETLLRKENVNV